MKKKFLEKLAEARKGYFSAGTIEDKTKAATQIEGFVTFAARIGNIPQSEGKRIVP